jgi:hypothetical protein
VTADGTSGQVRGSGPIARTLCALPGAPAGLHAGCARIIASALARPLLQCPGVVIKTKQHSEAWTVPLHVVVWTAMMVGFIMVFVVVLMH